MKGDGLVTGAIDGTMENTTSSTINGTMNGIEWTNNTTAVHNLYCRWYFLVGIINTTVHDTVASSLDDISNVVKSSTMDGAADGTAVSLNPIQLCH